MTKDKINILIVDDSLLTRVVLRDILQSDPRLCVVGEARDGREAVDAVLRLQPDLVIMDVVMPVMDGITAVKEIMSRRPTPILVLSANVRPGDARGAFNAIALGALDVMEKPRGAVQEVFAPLAQSLIDKVKVLARLPVRLIPSTPAPRSREALFDGRTRSVLAIGASTGGPKAVLSVLRHLPADCRAKILVVQHIAQGFAEGFADWLAREVPFSVRTAADGDPLRPGQVLVAPNNRHMEVRNDRIRLTDGLPVNSCKPSVDVLFTSLAHEAPREVAAVLLTGMGRDGAEGLAALRLAGATTLAQDEATSVVFGMPRAAIALDAAQRVLPLEEIPRVLARLLDRAERLC
ncbi:chemotaxis-specific protein-glutamate methyltransferase CheB [Geoalkalibacter halelectricus]|uniref:Protein-glutamate methylesterase/protein-glutamine glutaminase n=1 Tax=Geoalkalibacter halelectricus TaxID=2847045 RepID=A0ABY5ZML3_9BACT|nr:chemotaxis-specific protein-glutamate methyltransferase CheB [Geoalkalibacter halelectricus]MDO3378342.1 chemotaxis-specific protein-glutamate methyltransferase CheB [Geoalkalibacter halelectricus]UWZ80338.1 chemotaxis-specific protein-glutamate methyltransferase CheB [Geoalkalibacter halelectricus]